MVAALSPADINYDETLSTLRCVLERGGPRPRPGSGMVWMPLCLSQEHCFGGGHLVWGSLRLQVAVGGTWVCTGLFHSHRPWDSKRPGPLWYQIRSLRSKGAWVCSKGPSGWLQGGQPGWGAWVPALKEAAGLTGSHASYGKRRNGCGSLCRYVCTHL